LRDFKRKEQKMKVQQAIRRDRMQETYIPTKINKSVQQANPGTNVLKKWIFAFYSMSLEEAKTILQRFENPLKRSEKENEKWRKAVFTNMKNIISSLPGEGTPNAPRIGKAFKEMPVNSLSHITKELIALRKERRDKIEYDILFS